MTRHVPAPHAVVCCAGLLAVAIVAALPLQAHQRPDTSSRALAAAATAYVTEYQKAFAFLVADEDYRQKRVSAHDVVFDARRMRGELFLTYLSADREWIAVHDIAEVDGEPVPDREDLRELLGRGAALRGVMAQVIDRNARYNIGPVERNFNEPTLPLLIVAPERVRNVSFDRKNLRVERGVTLATLAFRERDRPTLVRGREGPLHATGELVLEAGTGRIHRTRFILAEDRVRAELETEYAYDDNVDLFVPSVFRERYETGRGADRELITCEARYTNYRRFTTSGRIK